MNIDNPKNLNQDYSNPLYLLNLHEFDMFIRDEIEFYEDPIANKNYKTEEELECILLYLSILSEIQHTRTPFYDVYPDEKMSFELFEELIVTRNKLHKLRGKL